MWKDPCYITRSLPAWLAETLEELVGDGVGAVAVVQLAAWKEKVFLCQFKYRSGFFSLTF